MTVGKVLGLAMLLALAGVPTTAAAQIDAPASTEVRLDWNVIASTSRTTPTLQVVVNPRLMPGETVRAGAYAALRSLDPHYARFVPWYPYPRLAVAELAPPDARRTSWDFKLIDPLVVDFMEATKGRDPMLNFSTIPNWMFKAQTPHAYPADVEKVDFAYNIGAELRDPSGREAADYFARIVSWYHKGGFVDENGQPHISGHHYDIPYWEVLNEFDLEHDLPIDQYIKIYDSVTAAIRAVSPQTRFIGLGLSLENDPAGFETFLDPAKHAPGTPLDWISYHFYASADPAETMDHWQYGFFAQADGFVDKVRYIEAIRKRLAPQVRTAINEVGSILPTDIDSMMGRPTPAIDPRYWNLSGALYAYLFLELSRLGIDVVGESQLVGYPAQFPSVSMVDWTNGEPNARFRVLALLKANFGPGDQIVDRVTNRVGAKANAAIGYIHDGKRKLLLINKRLTPVTLKLPADAVGAVAEIIDVDTASAAPRTILISQRDLTIGGFGVAVVTYR